MFKHYKETEMFKHGQQVWNGVRMAAICAVVGSSAGLALADDGTAKPTPPAAPTPSSVVSFHDQSVAGTVESGLLFVMIVFIVGVVLYFRYRRAQLLHTTLAKMIEKDVPIPTELFDAPRRKRSDLRRGAFWLALGVGVLVYLKVIGHGQWIGGLIPLLIGVAYLVVWRIEQGKPKA